MLYASASFAASYGGPAYSVSRLACSVKQAGAETALWAPDGSAPQLSLPDDAPRLLAGSLKEALAKFGPVDIVHDSGIWLPHNNQIAGYCAHSRIPLVVSTRGMLDPWALGHKRFKKAIAWQIYQKRNLNRASLLHVTSRQEADNIVRLGLRAPVHCIPNGVDLPDQVSRTAGDGVRRVVFLGRLHPVKGIAMLLDAWAEVRPVGWELVLAGPDENGFKATLAAQVARLGLNGVIRFAGPVAGTAKSDLLREASFLVLPSHSESFGMVVAEACAFGLPVVTTTAVPWPELEEHRCGWRTALTASAFADAMRTAMSLPQTELSEMGLRARKLAEEKFGWTTISDGFMNIYAGLIASAGRSASCALD